MSFPVSAPYRFCTTALNRVAPTLSRKISGYAGGLRVPAGENNDLFGTLSDWTEWMADRFAYLNGTRLEGVYLNTQVFSISADPADPMTVTYDKAREPLLARVTLTRGAVSHSFGTTASALIRSEGGYLQSVAIKGSDGGASGTVSVSINDQGAVSRGRFTGSLPTTYGAVTMTVADTVSAVDGPCYIQVDVEADTGGSSADTYVIGELVLTWGPRP